MCLLLVECGWQSAGNLSAKILSDLVWRSSCASSGHSGLYHEDRLLDLAHCLELEGDVGVGVQPKDLWVLVEGQALDVRLGISQGTLGWCVVGVELGEPVAV